MRKIKRKDRDRRRTLSASSSSFVTNVSKNEESLPWGASSWPILRAYVPNPDVWQATGCATLGIVRRAPNGNCWSAYAPIQLSMGGIISVYGDEDKPEARIDDLHRSLGDMVPPSEVGSPDLAARIVWGAYAWSLSKGQAWPPLVTKRFLNLFPKLGGVSQWWLDQLIGGPDPLVPLALQEALQRIGVRDDLPEGKEIAMTTLMNFTLPDPAGARAALAGDAENFKIHQEEPGVTIFFRMKERRTEPGRKVPFGMVSLLADQLVAHGPTFSLAAELVALLHKRIPGLKLVRTQWLGPQHLPFAAPGLMLTGPTSD